MTRSVPTPASNPDDPHAGGKNESPQQRRARLKKWATFLLRWTIAVVGIGWVILNTPLYDKVTVVDEQTMRPVKITLAAEFPDRAPAATIIDPKTKAIRTVSRDEPVNTPATKTVYVRDPAAGKEPRKRHLLALDLSDDLKKVQRLLIERDDGKGE